MSFQIETARLMLRDVREEDIPVLLAIYAEPEARENILSSQTNEDLNRRDLKNAIAWAKQARREYYKLSVTLKTGGDLIGTCNLIDVRAGCFETSIGWHYAHKYRGCGYATEAAREMLRIGFERHKVNEIYGDCFAENKASIRIFEKIGMVSTLNPGLIQIIRGWGYGENKPAVRYTISGNEWRQQQN